MNKQELQFTESVWEYYRAHGRHDLPWRQKTHLQPYTITVSEIMLQQTQVERVVPKYRAFMKKWPTARRLAAAPLGEVLIAWQGLGYNRRAKMLHQCAGVVTNELLGKWPQTTAGLRALPGIGPYTAGAVMAFAYNQSVPIIETNIRSVYLHHFFNDQTGIAEGAIEHLVAKTLDHNNPREWYWALMDYGVYIKKTFGNQNARAASYTKQSKFKGSDREIRGALIRTLSTKAHTKTALLKLSFDRTRLETQLSALENEGLVVRRGQRFSLPH